MGSRIVAGDETAKEEAQTLGRLLAENGFFFDLMAWVQKKVDSFMERKIRRNYKQIFSGGFYI